MTKNRTLMEYAVEYIKSSGRKNEELWQINFVRLKKQIYLPFELVGITGRSPTQVYYNLNKISQVQWRFMKLIEEEINESQKRIWKQFLTWLSFKQVTTTLDFEVAT